MKEALNSIAHDILARTKSGHPSLGEVSRLADRLEKVLTEEFDVDITRLL